MRSRSSDQANRPAHVRIYRLGTKGQAMPTNRILTQQEREAVLAKVKPVGDFKPANSRAPFGMQPVPWEERLGSLDEYRQHVGMGRAILPVLSDRIKTASVQNSILARLKKLYPEESWSTYVEGKQILLKFNGPKRHHIRRNTDEHDRRDSPNESELFAQTG